MATLKVVIRKNKANKDGLTKVNIAIYHHQKTAYIPLPVSCKEEEFSNGRIIKGKNAVQKNATILEYTNKYLEAMEDIVNIDYMDVTQVKDRIMQKGDKANVVSLEDALRVYREHLIGTKTIATINTVMAILRAYNKNRDIALQVVDREYMSALYGYLLDGKTRNGKKYSISTVSSYMTIVKAGLNYAVNNSNINLDVDRIFYGINCSTRTVRDNCITIEEFSRLRTYQTDNSRHRFLLDLFLLSFYTGGMNIVDLLDVSFLGHTIAYKRKKINRGKNVHNDIVLPITEEIRAIADRICDKDTGKIDYKRVYAGRFDTEKEIENLADRLSGEVCRLFGRIKDELGITSYITFYSARKFFAQTGLNIGISDTVIDYLLGHSNKNRGIISSYSAVNIEIAGEALRMISKFVENPEDIREMFRRNILGKIYGK